MRQATILYLVAAMLSLLPACKEKPPTSQNSIGDGGATAVVYDTLYNNGGYLVLQDRSRIEVTAALMSPMEDEKTAKMIDLYRDDPNPMKLGYADFPFDNALRFLTDLRTSTDVNPGFNINSDSLSLRIYMAKKLTGDSTTALFTMVYNKRATWIDSVAKQQGFKKFDFFKVYNDGGLCPTFCGNEKLDYYDDGIKPISIPKPGAIAK